jgi:acyl carrier protein
VFEKEDTKNKVVTIVADKLSIGNDVVLKSKSFQDLGADSLDMVEIIMKLEEKFGIEINDEDAEKLESLDQVVDYIQERRKR